MPVREVPAPAGPPPPATPPMPPHRHVWQPGPVIWSLRDGDLVSENYTGKRANIVLVCSCGVVRVVRLTPPEEVA